MKFGEIPTSGVGTDVVHSKLLSDFRLWNDDRWTTDSLVSQNISLRTSMNLGSQSRKAHNKLKLNSILYVPFIFKQLRFRYVFLIFRLFFLSSRVRLSISSFLHHCI